MVDLISKKIRGFRDILPEESKKFLYLEEKFAFLAFAEASQIYLLLMPEKKLKNKASLLDGVLRLNRSPLIYTHCFILRMTQKIVKPHWRAKKNKTLFL